MPRSPRYVRNRGRTRGQNYSSETSAFELNWPGVGAQVDQAFVNVPATTTYGVVKTKNFTVSINAIGILGAGGIRCL
jgi:hypothetical protein